MAKEAGRRKLRAVVKSYSSNSSVGVPKINTPIPNMDWMTENKAIIAKTVMNSGITDPKYSYRVSAAAICEYRVNECS